MPLSPALAAVGAERYVVLTTFRRSGQGVSTPVWVARDGDALVVTTMRGTGKVKRLRNDARVTLVPSSRRGDVAAGAVPVDARADVTDEPALLTSGLAAIKAKYGLLARMLLARRAADRVILRIA